MTFGTLLQKDHSILSFTVNRLGLLPEILNTLPELNWTQIVSNGPKGMRGNPGRIRTTAEKSHQGKEWLTSWVPKEIMRERFR